VKGKIFIGIDIVCIIAGIVIIVISVVNKSNYAGVGALLFVVSLIQLFRDKSKLKKAVKK